MQVRELESWPPSAVVGPPDLQFVPALITVEAVIEVEDGVRITASQRGNVFSLIYPTGDEDLRARLVRALQNAEGLSLEDAGTFELAGSGR